MDRQRDHLDLGKSLLDCVSGLQSVDAGHGQVHQHYVRFELLHQRDGLAAIGRLGDDLHVGLIVQEEPDALADDGVVFSYEDPYLQGHDITSRGLRARSQI